MNIISFTNSFTKITALSPQQELSTRIERAISKAFNHTDEEETTYTHPLQEVPDLDTASFVKYFNIVLKNMGDIQCLQDIQDLHDPLHPHRSPSVQEIIEEVLDCILVDKELEDEIDAEMEQIAMEEELYFHSPSATPPEMP